MSQHEMRPEEAAQTKPDRNADPESIYENFSKVPLRVLDAFIGLCIAALILVIAVGVLNR